ncbi:MAG: hypothetical protein JWM37_328 [Candidatus Saccharibacteria bacterium]|nr:hypothetical protein [Candidatus Saccharibacteria bacterium]
MKASRRLVAETIAARILAEPKQSAKWMQIAAAYLLETKQADRSELFLNDLAHELVAQGGPLSAEVVSARPLTAEVMSDLESYLKSATGATEIDVQVSHDPSLLGGFVARTPDGEIDKSVHHQLSQLRGIA